MQVTADEVRRLLGDIGDDMVADILGLGATESELQEVLAHLEQETDVMGEMERPLKGRALQIYNIVRRSEAYWDEDR